MATQSQINVTLTNGQATVTDNNGNVLSWVNLIYMALDPGTTPVLYLGCTSFNATLNVSPTAPATTSPGPTTTTPAPTPTGTTTVAPTST